MVKCQWKEKKMVFLLISIILLFQPHHIPFPSLFSSLGAPLPSLSDKQGAALSCISAAVSDTPFAPRVNTNNKASFYTADLSTNNTDCVWRSKGNRREVTIPKSCTKNKTKILYQYFIIIALSSFIHSLFDLALCYFYFTTH